MSNHIFLWDFHQSTSWSNISHFGRLVLSYWLLLFWSSSNKFLLLLNRLGYSLIQIRDHTCRLLMANSLLCLCNAPDKHDWSHRRLIIHGLFLTKETLFRLLPVYFSRHLCIPIVLLRLVIEVIVLLWDTQLSHGPPFECPLFLHRRVFPIFMCLFEVSEFIEVAWISRLWTSLCVYHQALRFLIGSFVTLIWLE